MKLKSEIEAFIRQCLHQNGEDLKSMLDTRIPDRRIAAAMSVGIRLGRFIEQAKQNALAGDIEKLEAAALGVTMYLIEAESDDIASLFQGETPM